MNLCLYSLKFNYLFIYSPLLYISQSNKIINLKIQQNIILKSFNGFFQTNNKINLFITYSKYNNFLNRPIYINNLNMIYNSRIYYNNFENFLLKNCDFINISFNSFGSALCISSTSINVYLNFLRFYNCLSTGSGSFGKRGGISSSCGAIDVNYFFIKNCCIENSIGNGYGISFYTVGSQYSINSINFTNFFNCGSKITTNDLNWGNDYSSVISTNINDTKGQFSGYAGIHFAYLTPFGSIHYSQFKDLIGVTTYSPSNNQLNNHSYINFINNSCSLGIIRIWELNHHFYYFTFKYNNGNLISIASGQYCFYFSSSFENYLVTQISCNFNNSFITLINLPKNEYCFNNLRTNNNLNFNYFQFILIMFFII